MIQFLPSFLEMLALENQPMERPIWTGTEAQLIALAELQPAVISDVRESSWKQIPELNHHSWCYVKQRQASVEPCHSWRFQPNKSLLF